MLDLAGNAEVRDAAAPWADRVDIVGAHLHPSGAPDELDGAGSVLVRPDGHVVWVGRTGSGPAGLAAALTRWFGKPAGG